MVSMFAPEVAFTILQRASIVCVPNNIRIIYAYCAYRPSCVQSDGIFRLHSLNCILTSGSKY